MLTQPGRGHWWLEKFRSVFALAALTAALLAFPVARAMATVTVTLAGTGGGTVTSSPAGINCSNILGAPGPSCESQFANFTPVELSASPGAGFVFSGWAADDPFGAVVPIFFPGKVSCNSGSAIPCVVINQASKTVHVTAMFGCVPPAASPVAVTGGSTEGDNFSLRTLEGTIDPESCGLEESFFEYGTTTEYGSKTSTGPAGRGPDPVPVSAETEPLEPNTTYHYRLVAVGPGGTSQGEDRSFTTGVPTPGGCPNEARRLEQGVRALRLPDCMALEMASPVQKHGAPAKNPNVSADGSRVSFVSQAALGENPAGLLSAGGATYVASRDESSWASQMTVPNLKPRLADQWSTESEWRPSFTPDFSRWLGIGATEQQLSQTIARAYEGGLGGFFRPLSQPFQALTFSNGSGIDAVVNETEFVAASADQSHLYFISGAEATYFPGDPTAIGPGAERAKIYLARSNASGELGLELLNRDRNDKVWGGNCGARLGGVRRPEGAIDPASSGARNQGAVSADGSRTYFSARAAQPQSGSCDEGNKLRILERFETPNGPQITPLFTSECSRPSLPDPPGPCSSIDGNDFYEGASVDQSKVYFTTNRQLTDTDLDGSSEECRTNVAVAGCDLYLYDRTRPAGERLIQVSAGEDVGAHETGKEADVFSGITGISADGSHVYFVAKGVLTDDTNPEGDGPQEGHPNLYLWDAGNEETTFLGMLNPEDGIANASLEHGRGLWGGEGTWRNGAYPVPVTEDGGDGHILVFESKAELTENDGDGSRLDVYRYDAVAETLDCLSCAPGSSPAEPDEAPFDVTAHGEASLPLPSGTDFAESWRWVNEDGNTVAFATAQGLLPGDVNGRQDFYLWKDGTLTRLPGEPLAGSEAPPEAVGPFLSHDGSTVAFVTATPLLPQDGDTTADVYVARDGGGYPFPPTPNPCEPGSQSNPCPPPPPPPPPVANVNSEALGAGNPKPHGCPKGRVFRHGHCVAKHKRHAKKGGRNRRNNNNRRAAK